MTADQLADIRDALFDAIQDLCRVEEILYFPSLADERCTDALELVKGARRKVEQAREIQRALSR